MTNRHYTKLALALLALAVITPQTRAQSTYTPYTFTTLAGQAGSNGSADGTGNAARFQFPLGVAVDSAGNVYVAEYGNHTIRKVTPAGVVTTLAGLAGNGGSTDGTGSAARFNNPAGAALDGANNVYVTDYVNHTIRIVTPVGANWVVTTVAGLAGSVGSADGTGSAARFYSPDGVAVDSAGNVYVADSFNHTIRKMTPAGVVTTLAGQAGSVGSVDGTGSAARFYLPEGVAVDSAGNVYVADTYNHTIRKVTSAGVVATLAGLVGSVGSADGTGSAARFNYPEGLAVDSEGNVYVADHGNHTIRKVTPAGVVTTLAGSAGTLGSADGTGSAAQFSDPWEVAVDTAGNVYVADYGNHTIRKGTPAQSCVPSPEGLVAWWRGEDDATDVVATNNGTLMNGATFVPGEVGQAFHLDGVDDFVEIPNSPAFNPSNQITVMAWWKSVSFGGSGNDVIVQKAYISHSAPYYQYMLGVEGGGRAFNFYVASGVGSSGGIGAGANTGGGFWVPAQWYHLVGTYDGSTVKLYVNGTLRDSQPASGLLSDYGRTVRIGAHANVTSFTPGDIDEVAIFNRALTSDEVASIYAAGNAGLCLGPGPTNSPPTILTQPQSRTNTVGSTVALSVLAGGTAPLTYQWLSNSVPLADGGRVTGANSNQLTIANLQLSDSGGYYAVIVSNAFGSVLSSNAVLVVTTNITWTGAVSSDWNNPANWNPQQVPSATDHVVVNSGGIAVPADASFAILDWNGGTISGSLTVASGTTFNWTGGTLWLNSSLTVASNGLLNISGSADKYIYSPLINAGTVVWSGTGDLRFNLYYNFNNWLGPIHNLAGALFDIQNDGACYPDAATGYFSNAGTVRKSAGSGTMTMGVVFDNAGTVDVQSGTLNFNAGGGVGGQFTTTTGTAVNLSGGSFVEQGLPIFSGSGQSRFIGGTLTLTTDVIPNLALVSGGLAVSSTFQGGGITNLTLSAGLTLLGNSLVTGTMNWTGGDLGINGSLTVASNGLLNISGSADKYIYSPLINAGTVVWSGTGDLHFNLYYNFNNWLGPIHNLAGALFDIQNDAACYPDTATGYFSNAGTVRKSAGSGTTTISAFFDNTGTIDAKSGKIALNGVYSETSSANLSISLGGTAPGSGYGHINFSTPLSMEGTFAVSTRNGYLPNPGDTFSVLSYPASTNSFTCLSGLDLGGGLLLQPHYNATGLTLTTTTYTTGSSQPQLFISRSANGIVVQWPLGFPGWVLQSNTNLASSFWSPVPVACDNQALLPVTAPSQFFRLKQ